MDDVNCPYCGKEQEIDHADGYGYKEDEIFEQECWSCEKTFAYTTSIIFHYTAKKADCLNGGPHLDRKVVSFPDFYPNRKRCEACGREEYGGRDEKKVKEYFASIKGKRGGTDGH